MDSTILNNLRGCIASANRHLAGRNFQLMFDPSDTEHAYIVDLSNKASCNVLSGFTAERFAVELPCWFFEVYYVGDVAADEYSVDPGYYLAISFYLS